VDYALYYLLTCGGTTGSQDVAAAAAAFRAVPHSNHKYAAVPGLVELRLQLLQVGRRCHCHSHHYYQHFEVFSCALLV
jgi:hypothetical protein